MLKQKHKSTLWKTRNYYNDNKWMRLTSRDVLKVDLAMRVMFWVNLIDVSSLPWRKHGFKYCKVDHRASSKLYQCIGYANIATVKYKMQLQIFYVWICFIQTIFQTNKCLQTFLSVLGKACLFTIRNSLWNSLGNPWMMLNGN